MQTRTKRKPERPYEYQTKQTSSQKLERHQIITKGSVYYQDIKIINTYTPNYRAPKYIKRTFRELKKKNRQSYNDSWKLQYRVFNNK